MISKLTYKTILSGVIILLSSYGILVGSIACSSGHGGGSSPIAPLQPNGVIPNAPLIPPGAVLTYRAQQGLTNSPTLSLNGGYSGYLQNAMGVCNRCENSGGLASCQSWMSGYNDITLKINSAGANTVSIMIRSSPLVNGYSNYAYNFPSVGDFFLYLGTGGMAPIGSCYYGGSYPQLVLPDMSIGASNGSSGFVVYGYAAPVVSAWNRRYLRLYINSGNAGDPVLNFHLKIMDENSNESQIASGQLQLCQPGACDY